MKIKLLITVTVCGLILGCSSTVDNAEAKAKNKPTVSTKAFSLSNEAIIAEDIASLRGKHALRRMSVAPKESKWIKNGDYDVSFESQPPLVPHKSEHMRVTIKDNSCLNCHSNANYKEEEAAKMPSSHFKTRMGKRLKTVSPRRYFCKQCHVSQVDAEPLVGNTYVNTDE
ncbi:MAG: nitrate reductase cytochrome c-type subunit [Gammaproteobacteria bacterium]|nr:nitrate reductase cytochrome c-type subunit [Gammaproteobacteria bacterium]